MKTLTLVNSIAVWLAIAVLLLLGVRADTRSVQRDSYALEQIISIQGAVKTNQSAIINLLEAAIDE